MPEAVGEVATACKVSVAKDCQIAEVNGPAHAADVRQVSAEMWLPDSFLGTLWSEEHHALAIVQDEPLDQHQPDERLTQAYAVAEKSASVLASDVQQRPIRF